MRALSTLACWALALLAGPVHGDEFTAPLYDFLSRPDIRSERITVSHYNPHGVAPGYIFLTPWAPEVQKGVNYDFSPAIYDNHGELVWSGFDSKDRRAGTQVFFMTEYDGEPALAYYHIQKSSQLAVASILNDRYELVHSVTTIDTQNYTWSAESEALNGLAKNGALPLGIDMHDLNIVTGPARTEAWPVAGVDPVDEAHVDENGNPIRRKRTDLPAYQRVAKRKTQTTALMTMGRIVELEEQFQICGQNMTWLHASGFQEISLDGKNTLLFQWDPVEHIPVNDTLTCGNDFDHGDIHAFSIGQHPWHTFDFFHRNSVDKDANGDYIVSSRHMSTVFKISGQNGTILWRLGGKHSSFEHISNVPGVQFEFGWQHDARIANVPGADPTNGIMGLTLWDNSNNIYDYSNKVSNFSSGKSFLIDERTMRATLVEAYTLPGRLLGVNQGSHQALPNGNRIIGGGNIGMVAEYAPSRPQSEQQVLADPANNTEKADSPMGELVFAAHYGAGPMNSYRASRFDWHGYPSSAPALFGYSRSCPNGTDAGAPAYYYVSWNGATEVATWEIHGSDYPHGPFEKIAETRRTGFESMAKGPFKGFTFAVGFDASGHELGGSETIRTWVPEDPYVDDGTVTHNTHASQHRMDEEKHHMVLDGGSCSSHRCSQGFKYRWSRAKTCPGLDPPPVELDLITDGWTNGGWHMDGTGITVSVTKTYTKLHPPTTDLAVPDEMVDEVTTTTTHTAPTKVVVAPPFKAPPPPPPPPPAPAPAAAAPTALADDAAVSAPPPPRNNRPPRRRL